MGRTISFVADCGLRPSSFQHSDCPILVSSVGMITTLSCDLRTQKIVHPVCQPGEESVEKKRYIPKPGTNGAQSAKRKQAELRSAGQTGRLPLREWDDESATHTNSVCWRPLTPRPFSCGHRCFLNRPINNTYNVAGASAKIAAIWVMITRTRRARGPTFVRSCE